MFVIERHIVPEGIHRARLSDYAVGKFEAIFSRKGIKNAIKNGLILVDGRKAHTGYWVRSGNKIELLESDSKSRTPFPLRVDVVYEDDYLAVIFKPGGLLISGTQFRTLENALPNNLKASTQKDKMLTPRCVHRLDRPTCGLVVVAKTRSARISLGKQFEEKQIDKRYRAIVMGQAPERGVFDDPIDNKPATTRFELIHSVPSLKSEVLCLLDLFPETGRTHQLRIHLSKAGFPILGDLQYGREGEVLKGKGLFLCAVELKFTHPVTGEPINCKVDEPNKFQLQMEREERRWKKFRESE
ncbi:MAG: RluA family pseudouridine synthase [Bacteroidota bacterium]